MRNGSHNNLRPQIPRPGGSSGKDASFRMGNHQQQQQQRNNVPVHPQGQRPASGNKMVYQNGNVFQRY